MQLIVTLVKFLFIYSVISDVISLLKTFTVAVGLPFSVVLALLGYWLGCYFYRNPVQSKWKIIDIFPSGYNRLFLISITGTILHLVFKLDNTIINMITDVGLLTIFLLGYPWDYKKKLSKLLSKIKFTIPGTRPVIPLG